MGSPEQRKKAEKSPNSKTSSAASFPPFTAPAKHETPAISPYSSDWAASLQAYYSSGAGTPPPPPPPPPFFPHVWGGQHLMPPYGTPIACSPMYAAAAVYAPPSLAAGMGHPTGDFGNGKPKGAHGKLEGRKASAGSSDDSQRSSRGSATEGSSDTRDISPGLQDDIKKRTFKDAFQEGEALQPRAAAAESACGNKARTPKLPVSAPGRTTLSGPATNLNIGMDIWNPPAVGCVPFKVGSNETVANGTVADRSWIQDERELKRERRKQSNRESARRSRLRKQQECEELQRKVAELNSENSALRIELEQLQKVCKDLEVENQQITEELHNIRGNSSPGSTQNGDHGSKVPRSSSLVGRENYLPGGNFEPNSR